MTSRNENTTSGLVRIWRDHGVAVVVVVGVVDVGAESALEQRLRGVMTLTDSGLVLDLTRLGASSSRGAQILAGFVHATTNRGVEVAVVGLTSWHTQLWLLTGIPVPVQYATTENAVGALRRRGADPGPAGDGVAGVQDLSALQEQVHHLRRAMVHQATIEQAKGRVMERLQCSPGEAFAFLSGLSQRSNRKLHLVAEDVLATTIDDVLALDRSGRRHDHAGHRSDRLNRAQPS